MRQTMTIGSLLLTIACGTPPSPPAEPPPSPAFPSGTLVDLTHAYDAQTVFWPTSTAGFELDKVAEGMTPGGYYYAANNFRTAEHGGTHIDAPVHFAEGRQSVDQIPLDRLMGGAITIDVSDAAAGNPDYQITTQDFLDWEREHGQIPAEAIVLLRTGFSARWPDPQGYLGTAEKGAAAVPKLHFPGLHPEAARWIVANRPIKSIGIDTASIDFGQSTLFESHRVLYERNIPAFENLTNLDRLPPTGAVVVALPMKIKDGSGGPLRAVAMLPR